MKKYYVNAFAKTIDGGNPAGVVLNADNLTEKEMLEIASDIGFSETAFVSSSEKADFRVRFFTPSDEVDLCGHATIATFSLLKSLNIVKAGTYTQETKAGVLSVQVTEDDLVLMEQLKPKKYDTVNKEEIALSLGIKSEDIISPVQVFSTGLKDIIVHVKSLDILNNMVPNFKLISDISENFESTGYHVFTLETLYGNTAHCRNFAPLYAIDEESATGTASGAMAGYLISNKLVNISEGINHFTFEQGYTMKRPSEIKAQIEIKDNEVTRVIVGGKSIIV